MARFDEQLNELMQWRNIKQFFSIFWRYLIEVNSFQSASALAYMTLLSLVPLITVSFSIFANFPVFESWQAQLQHFVFETFVPTASATIQATIQAFAIKAKHLTSVGLTVLLVTSIIMMSTIEKSLNFIWRIEPSRSFLRRFVIYWSVLTLGPLMMGAGLAMTSYVVSLPLFSETASRLGILRFLPFLLEIFTFTLLYLVVPNTRVRITHALLGGLLAALLFELSKFSFTWYVSNFPTYDTIYGTLATVPIFLIWLYVSWWVALVGASFTYIFGVFRAGGVESMPETDTAADLLSAYTVLKQLWCAQDTGHSVALNDIALKEIHADENRSLERILRVLSDCALVTRDERGAYLLSRNLNKYSLLDLYHSHAYSLPKTGPGQPLFQSLDTALRPILERIDDTLSEAMDTSLANLFEMDRSGETMPVLMAVKNA